MHTVYFPELADARDTLTIEGDEAAHANRVKRLRPGEMVRVLDGRGLVATAIVAEARRALHLEVRSLESVPPIAPAIDVWSATPKGPRIAELIEGLVQVGTASWTPTQTKLGIVDPRDAKLERMQRIVVEASKQAACAWFLRIEAKRTLSEALAPDSGTAIVMADASGEAYEPSGSRRIRILVGPEGGWTSEEREAARRAGASLARFGPHIMRIETAAVVAAAVVREAEIALR